MAHMAVLRRTLVDDQTRNRYIVSVTERGYRFVATRSRFEKALPFATSAAAVEESTHNLPTPSTQAIGRAKIVTSLATYLLRSRFITLVRAGDIGKATVALGRSEARRAVRWRRCEGPHRCKR